MEEQIVSQEDYIKYAKAVNKYLEKEEGLAGIAIRLQNAGLTRENARKIVKEVALEHSKKAKSQAVLSLVLGAAGLVIFGLIGLTSKRGAKYFFFAAGSVIGGAYQYFKTQKRIKYLTSID